MIVWISEPLFELLVEISSKDCDNLDNEECGERLTSIATSCLLSLIIAWGITPKLLQALAHLITATHSLADQEITVSDLSLLFSLILNYELKYHIERFSNRLSAIVDTQRYDSIVFYYH